MQVPITDVPCPSAMSLVSALFLASFIVLAPGCSERQSTPTTGKDSSALIVTTESFPPHERDTINAPKGTWEVRTVRAALEAGGLGPVSDKGPVRLPFLGPEGSRLAVRGAEIQVYIYADALARARETDLIDSLQVAPANGHVVWTMPASIIVINNVALIVLTSDDFLRRRIHAAVRLHRLRDNG